MGDRAGGRLRWRALVTQPDRRLRRDHPDAQGAPPLTAFSAAHLRDYAPDPDLYRPSSCPSWVDELDLSVSGAHVRMGTRALPPGLWLVRDETAQSELALRRRLLAEQRDQVLACSARAQAAAEETEALVGSWLTDHGLAPTDRVADSHPLARAGLGVQEDLCLMVHHTEAWHLEGAVVCFPSMWSLHEKLGRPVTAVHAPVRHYAEELAGRVDTFFDRLRPGNLVRRRNLSLWPACLLWVPTPTLADELWDPAPIDGSQPRLWLRSERQTLRRLPETSAILFTIRVQMAPLAVLADAPGRAAALAAWMRGPGGESRRDQLGPLLQTDLAWLDRVSSSPAD